MLKRIRSLCVIVPKMSVWRRDFAETKYLSLCIKDNEMLEKHNEIWETVINSRKKYFESKLVYNEKYLKTKIKPYKGKINTNFHNNKISKKVLNVFTCQ